MRDRGKLARALLVAAALGAAAIVVSRRLVRGSAAEPEIPEGVRTAVEEGIVAGSNGRGKATEPEWIPVAAVADPGEEALGEPAPSTGLAAPA